MFNERQYIAFSCDYDTHRRAEMWIVPQMSLKSGIRQKPHHLVNLQ